MASIPIYGKAIYTAYGNSGEAPCSTGQQSIPAFREVKLDDGLLSRHQEGITRRHRPGQY